MGGTCNEQTSHTPQVEIILGAILLTDLTEVMGTAAGTLSVCVWEGGGGLTN